jgi:hypothetical protein
VLFFEGPHDSTPAKSTRVYLSSFPQATTRTIYWELNLNFSRPGQRTNFKIMAHWVKPDGSEMGQQPLDATVESDATTSSNALGWGWVDAGHWTIGTYRLDLYSGSDRVASGTFQIDAAPAPPPPPPPPPPLQSWGIPIPGLKTPIVQFYEGPHDKTPEKSERVYRYAFASASTRTIYYEVDLNFPKPSQQINFKMTAHWIKPDGSQMGQQSLDAYVKPEWATSWHSQGWGWVDAGHWGIGTYRLDVYVGDMRVASGTFNVN